MLPCDPTLRLTRPLKTTSILSFGALEKMNLTLYAVTAFIILDSDGNRVMAKYYRPKGHPEGEPKGFATVKEQKAFEKGLWQKTKKAGG